jgi:dTDP-4-amino-4,6-dideoxygalactose transaminase
MVPALTWIATAEAVNNVGAKPVFVDVDAVTYTIDVEKIEEKISSKTRAIIPVHLYGCPANMHELGVISKKHKLHLVEDCAQAHGAEYFEKKVGTFGIASAFSFFPTKNLGAYGDAGAVVTDDPALYEKVKRISNHGQASIKHDHKLIGRNSRLDTLQAAILKVKLKYLDLWNQKRIGAAMHYIERLKEFRDIALPFSVPDTKHVYHIFVIRTNNRDTVMEILKRKEISCAVHYPRSLPFTEAYKHKMKEPDDYSVSRRLTEEILSLPIYPEIENHQIDIICDQIIGSL